MKNMIQKKTTTITTMMVAVMLMLTVVTIAGSLWVSFAENTFVVSNGKYVITDGNKLTVQFIGVSKKSATSVTIPASVKIKDEFYKVTSIKANALKGNTKIKKLTIGSNVKTIGKKAFYGCKNLKTVTINTTKLTISSVKADAFKGLNGKAKVTVPADLGPFYETMLEAKGLNGTNQKVVEKEEEPSKPKQTKVGNGQYRIISEDDLFVEYICPVNEKASSVTIPDTVKIESKTYAVVSIAKGAFNYSCSTLKTVTIGKNVVCIGNFAFNNCSKINNMTIETTHLRKDSIGSKSAFNNLNNKITITVPNQKLNDYKQILKVAGVKGKNQKIVGKTMDHNDAFTNTVYDPDAIPVPEISMGLNTAFELRKIQTKETDKYDIGDTIPVTMKAKMPTNLSGTWKLYLLEYSSRPNNYIQCGSCDRAFEAYAKSGSLLEDFDNHTYAPINSICNNATNFFIIPKDDTVVAWKKVFAEEPCSATFKIKLPDGLDYKKDSIKIYLTFTLPGATDYYGDLSDSLEDDLYNVKISGKEIIVTIDNVKTLVPESNYHLSIELQTSLNENATDKNVIESTLTYQYKNNTRKIDCNEVTVLKP